MHYFWLFLSTRCQKDFTDTEYFPPFYTPIYVLWDRFGKISIHSAIRQYDGTGFQPSTLIHFLNCPGSLWGLWSSQPAGEQGTSSALESGRISHDRGRVFSAFVSQWKDDRGVRRQPIRTFTYNVAGPNLLCGRGHPAHYPSDQGYSRLSLRIWRKGRGGFAGFA